MPEQHRPQPMFLRLIGLIVVTGGAWSGLTAESGDGGSATAAGLTSVALVAVAFLLAFRDDPYIRRAVYAGAGLATLAALAVVALADGFSGGAADWILLLVKGASGFLAVAVAVSAFSGVIYACAISTVLEVVERRQPGPVLMIKELILSVLAATYAIPVGVATAVLVGVNFEGWQRPMVGLAAAILVCALGSSASLAMSQGLAFGPLPLRIGSLLGSAGNADAAEAHEAAARAPADLAAVVVGVVASVMVGASEVSEFVLGLGVELLFTVIVAGALSWMLLWFEVELAERGIGRLPTMALASLVGAAIGIIAGVFAADILIGDAAAQATANASALAPLLFGAAAVAFFLQRLAAVVGFVAVGALVALGGAAVPTVLAAGAIGGIGGIVLVPLPHILLLFLSDSYALRAVVFTCGIGGAIAAGLLSGLPLALR